MSTKGSSSERLLQERGFKSTSTIDKRPTRTAETQIFGPPFAYYKDHKHEISFNLWIAAILTTVICAVDFLLATNIVIYVRTMNPDSKEDVIAHTALILLHVALIWITYRLMVWYVNAYGIKDKVKQNKFYQKVATEVIELETMLRTDGQHHVERFD